MSITISKRSPTLPYKSLALPVNEYLNALIIIQLSIKLVLLAAWRFFCLSKRGIKKKTPDDAGPAGSPVLLASGGTLKTRFGVFFHHRLRCSAAPNGEQHACAYLSRYAISGSSRSFSQQAHNSVIPICFELSSLISLSGTQEIIVNR